MAFRTVACALLLCGSAAAVEDEISFIQSHKPGKITRAVKVAKRSLGLSPEDGNEFQAHEEEAKELQKDLAEDFEEMKKGLARQSSDTRIQAEGAWNNIKDTVGGLANGLVGRVVEDESPAEPRQLNLEGSSKARKSMSAREGLMHSNLERRRSNRKKYWKFIANRTRNFARDPLGSFRDMSVQDAFDNGVKQARRVGESIRDGAAEIGSTVKGVSAAVTGSYSDGEDEETPADKADYRAAWKQRKKANRNKYWQNMARRTGRWSKEAAEAFASE